MELMPGYTQTPTGVIPEGWRLTCLGAHGETYGGLTGKTKKDFGTGDARYVTFINVISNVVIDCDVFDRVHITAAESQNRVRKNDLLFNGSSETPEEVAFCAVHAGDVSELYLNSFCFGYRLRDQLTIDPFFLAYFFRSRAGRELVKALAQGSTRYNISKRALLCAPLVLPAAAEQHAIAQALSDVDTLLATLDQVIAKKRDLKQAAMQQLLTGETRLPGFEGEWVECKLVELANFYDNLRIPVTESKREIGITPYYGANGIQGYIKGHTHDGEFVLIAEDGANDLNNYPVLYVNGKVWVNNHAHVIQGIPDKANTKYLSYALKNVDFVQVLVGGTRAKLNGSEAKAIKIIIPSDIEEQTAIATILSDMDAEIAALEQRRNKTKDIKQAMMQELLTGKTRLVDPRGANA